MGSLKVGDKAPDFTLPDQNGQLVTLTELLDKNTVVLYFYPKDDSQGCTAEACAFRDSYEAFTDAGATVVGVSLDSTDSHKSFATKHRLPFILLSDVGGKVSTQYDVLKMFGMFRSRETFVIDRQGIIRHQFSSQINMSKHATEALDIIKSMKAAPTPVR